MHTDKTKKTEPQKTNQTTVQQQVTGESVSQFTDYRPEAVAQRKLQEEISESSRATQLRAIQELSENGSKAMQAAQLHMMAAQHVQRKKVQHTQAPSETVQKQAGIPAANNTGLPDTLKSGIENLSGYAMDDVKVHYNSDKPAQLSAHAYAQGTDIHLGPGQEKHLPHEAWHVVQQKQGRVAPTTQLKNKVNINDDAGLEKEADVMGAKALQQKKNNDPVYQRKNSVQQQEVTSKNVAQREGDEEEKESGKGGKGSKHKKEAAWKPVQLKKKSNFPGVPEFLEQTNKAPIQGEWINREEGPEYGLLQWKQTEKDDKFGHYLEDGWYKAKNDFRTYWAIKLKDTEIEDIRAGRVMVWVRPWVITMKYPSKKSDSAAGHTDLSLVFDNIREIWKQANIGIQVDAPIEKEITLSQELDQYKSKEELSGELNKLLQGDINAYAASDLEKGKEGIQAVFVPSYDRMGYTYHKGDKGYAGPVTFVATGTVGVGKSVLKRDNLSPSQYVNTAVSLDAAHEIGHAFGLEHIIHFKKAEMLMHSSLYHKVITIEKQPSEEEALNFAKEKFSEFPNPIIFQSTVGGDKLFWTALHGSKLSEEQIKLVLKNVTGKKLW